MVRVKRSKIAKQSKKLSQKLFFKSGFLGYSNGVNESVGCKLVSQTKMLNRRRDVSTTIIVFTFLPNFMSLFALLIF